MQLHLLERGEVEQGHEHNVSKKAENKRMFVREPLGSASRGHGLAEAAAHRGWSVL
jgi:hypothetical protein